MSTLWTPDGERPIRRDPPPDPPTAPAGDGGGGAGPPRGGAPSGARRAAGSAASTTPAGGDTDDAEREPTDEELEQLRQELATTPVEVVVANHAYGLFQLASLHLSLRPPQLPEARTAIDAYGALVEGMQGRLGESERQLAEGLNQLRMVFVQISSALRQAAAPPEGGGKTP